ncbi:MAG: DnaJ domain-containing protein, partial [Proteobacteria bacterium]|nr:DnaJ domain-containing protein [Pseudomonadota bacterium]
IKGGEEKPKKAPVTPEKQTGVQILDEEDKDPLLSQIPRAFRSRILLLDQELDTKTFFEMLEVSPSADSDLIHANYLRLVKEFHPDSLRIKETGHYRRNMEKIFVKIQEAYQEIHPENKRAAYLHELMDGRRTKKDEKKPKYEYKVPKKDVEFTFANAETQYARGLKEEKKGNLQAALNFFQMAVGLKSDKKVYEESVARIREKMLKKHLKDEF